MKVLIKETQIIEELSLVDPYSKICWFSDFASVGTNIEFEHVNHLDDEEIENLYEHVQMFIDVSYLVTQDTYDWWKSVVDSWQTADDLKFYLKNDKEITNEIINEIEEECDGHDLDIQAMKRLEKYLNFKNIIH